MFVSHEAQSLVALLARHQAFSSCRVSARPDDVASVDRWALWAQAKMIVVPKQDHIHVHSKPKHKIGIDVIFLLCFNDVFYFILLLLACSVITHAHL